MKSLLEELGFEERYEVVYESEDKEIHAHTIYYEIEKIDYEQFVTEDDTPVDNLFSELQQRMLIEALRMQEWTTRDFMACSKSLSSAKAFWCMGLLRFRWSASPINL